MVASASPSAAPSAWLPVNCCLNGSLAGELVEPLPCSRARRGRRRAPRPGSRAPARRRRVNGLSGAAAELLAAARDQDRDGDDRAPGAAGHRQQPAAAQVVDQVAEELLDLPGLHGVTSRWRGSPRGGRDQGGPGRGRARGQALARRGDVAREREVGLERREARADPPWSAKPSIGQQPPVGRDLVALAACVTSWSSPAMKSAMLEEAAREGELVGKRRQAGRTDRGADREGRRGGSRSRAPGGRRRRSLAPVAGRVALRRRRRCRRRDVGAPGRVRSRAGARRPLPAEPLEPRRARSRGTRRRLGRRCGSAARASRPCRPARERPCRARRGGRSTRGSRCAPARRTAAACSCSATEASSSVTSSPSLAASSRFGARTMNQKRERRPRPAPLNEDQLGRLPFISASRDEVGCLLGLADLLGSTRGGAVLAGWRRQRRPGPGTAGAAVAVAGGGTASKATTISNWAMKSRVRQSSSPSSAAGRAGRSSSAESGRSEPSDPDPGDAVDVLERGDEAGDGLLAGRAADQLQRRAGDAVARSVISAPSSTATAGATVPVRLTSQTSVGQDQRQLRITRSQSKRLWARLVTVASRVSCTARKWVKGRRPRPAAGRLASSGLERRRSRPPSRRSACWSAPAR